MPTCECGTVIFFAQTDAGKPMPIVRDSVDRDGGNLACWRDPGDQKLHCRIVKAGEDLAEGEHRCVSHFATCPKGPAFRKQPRLPAVSTC